MIFLNKLCFLVLFGLLRADDASVGRWCASTRNVTKETVVTQRQQRAVECLDLYKYIQSGWTYDESRMKTEHGGETGVSEYFKSEGASALCYVFTPGRTLHYNVTEETRICCPGWVGKNCDQRHISLGSCFYELGCASSRPSMSPQWDVTSHRHRAFSMEACCALLGGKSWRSLDEDGECKNCSSAANTERNQTHEQNIRPSCVMWGRGHVSGFGGKVRSVASTCAHRLAAAADASWWVDAQQSECGGNRSICAKSLRIRVDEDVTIVLQGRRVYINDKMLSFISDQSYKGVTLRKIGDFVIISYSGDLTVKYSPEIVVVTTSDVIDSRGLCGEVDFVEDLYVTDIVPPSGTATNTRSLTSRDCGIVDVTSRRRSCAEDSALLQISHQSCAFLRHDDAFKLCRRIHDVTLFYDACVDLHCRNSASFEDGANHVTTCHVATAYAFKCAASGVKVGSWMERSNCSRGCPAEMHFRDCVTSCPATCDVPSVDGASPYCHDDCIPGCQCPPGQLLHRESRNGDVIESCVTSDACPCQHRGRFFPRGSEVAESCNTCVCEAGGTWSCSTNQCRGLCHVISATHVVTFDQARLSLSGSPCLRNVLLQTADQSAISVRVAMDLSRTASDYLFDVAHVYVTIGSDEVKMKRNMEATVNGVEAKLPFRNKNMSLRRATTHAFVVRSLGFELIWIPNSDKLDISLQPMYSSKIVGLCGNYNWNPRDDFTTLDGDVESVPETFVRKFQQTVDGFDCPAAMDVVDDDVMTSDPCLTHTQKRDEATRLCGLFAHSIFQNCRLIVDEKPYSEACRRDVCTSSDVNPRSACRSLAAYVIACLQEVDETVRSSIVAWRNHEELNGACELTCPSYLAANECQSPSTSSCTDVSRPLPSYGRDEVTNSCYPGCECPVGYKLAAGGAAESATVLSASVSRGFSGRSFLLFGVDMTCVPMESCPCFTRDQDHQPGSTLKRGCVECTCTAGKWNCSSRACGATVRCPNNMEYSRQVTVCDRRTCNNADRVALWRDRGDCDDEFSYEGCKCPDGMVVQNDRCIPIEDCPCLHGGRLYKANETVQRDCNRCICKSRQWHCTEKKCSAHCVAMGDPHYVTFDGAHYSFQGTCSYVLARERSGLFSVTAENVPCGATGVTCTKSVYITVGATVIHMLRGKRVTVNGAPVARLPRRYGDDVIGNDVTTMALDRAGVFVVSSWPNLGLSVYWDGGTRVGVQVRPQHMGNMTGLCGNYDRSSSNDFTTRHGSVETLTSPFTDSWRVSPVCSETSAAAGVYLNPCEANPHRASWSRRKCSIISVGRVFAHCRKVVPHQQYYDWCVNDACACDGGGDCECVCTAVAAYSHECNRNHEPARWRSQAFCPMQCDGGKVYKACGPVCEDTCRLQGRDLGRHCAEMPCVEGCFCPSGFVTHGRRCVKVDECPCFSDGGEFASGSNMMRNCQNCTCEMGKWNCTGSVCDSLLPTCGQGEFRCANGFQCVSKLWRCDFERDCLDGSDEIGCNRTISECFGSTGHVCDGSRCLPGHKICDGVFDCDDLSDELDCNVKNPNVTATCGAGEFACSSGKCISGFLACDGKFDCGFGDFSDESECVQNCSVLHQFACDNGSCIARSSYCDGAWDCVNGEDETNCHCPPTHFTCADGGCIDRITLCDNAEDCMQGEDEMNCTGAKTTSPPITETVPSTFSPSTKSCPQFHCTTDVTICVPWKRVCDDIDDCPDRSDETEHCWSGCREGEFSCDNGARCIDVRLLCDGLNHCLDKSDETHESCSTGNTTTFTCNSGFACGDGVCINGSMVCDGITHCYDADDERDCPDETSPTVSTTIGPTASAPATECDGYSCLNGKCISLNKVCNGMDECLDGQKAGNDSVTSSMLVLRYTSSDEAGCSTWSDWGNWAPCSRSCGSGVQQRNRTCSLARDDDGHVINGDPLRSECRGRASVTRPCFTEMCQNNTNTLTDWSAWTPCGVTCGGGLSSRWRSCSDGSDNCTDALPASRRMYGIPMLEIRSCSEELCPDQQCAGNKIFHECDADAIDVVNPCPLTCRDYVRGGDASCVTSSSGCVDGCFCPYGNVLRNDSTDECVPTHQCPCYVNGQTFEVGEEVRRKDICQICQCLGGGRLGECSEDPDCDDTALCGWTDWSGWGPCFGPCGVNGVQWAFRSPLRPSRYGKPRNCRGSYRKSKRCQTSPCPTCDVTGRGRSMTSRKIGEQWREGACNLCACAENGTVSCQKFCEYSAVGCPHNETLVQTDEGCCYCQTNLSPTTAPTRSMTSSGGLVTSVNVVRKYLTKQSTAKYTTTTQPQQELLEYTTVAPTDWTQPNTSSAAPTCGKDMFTCVISNECLNRSSLCDGVVDCLDASDEDVTRCHVTDRDVTCAYGEWSGWSECSSSCGLGKNSRHRGLVRRSDEVGSPLNMSDCKGPYQDYRVCFVAACARDGAWSAWQPWSQCSLTCGGGIQTRRRSCDSPAPLNGGKGCPGVCSETKVCNAMPCTPGFCKGGRLFVNGSRCSEFEACSQTCADLSANVRCRSECEVQDNLGGCFCPQGRYLQDGSCVTMDQCRCTVNNMVYEPGSLFTFRGCDCTCVNGRSSCRSNCSTDCGWSNWSAWSHCDSPCGLGGQVHRFRSPSNPTATGPLGARCDGQRHETRPCDTSNGDVMPCEPSWSEWTAWSRCSASCGVGRRTRTRQCLVDGDPTSAYICQATPNWSTPHIQSRACSSTNNDSSCSSCPPGSSYQCSRCPTTCDDVTYDVGVGEGCGDVCMWTCVCPRGMYLQNNKCVPITSCSCNLKRVATRYSLPVQRIDSGSEITLGCNNCTCVSGRLVCTNHQCEDGWLPWSPWSQCSRTCVDASTIGTRQRHRICSRRGTCSGDNRQTVHCGLQLCANEAQWTAWSSWSQCDRTCDGGLQVKRRICRDMHGNLAFSCQGTPHKVKSCFTDPCRPGFCPPGSNLVRSCGNCKVSTCLGLSGEFGDDVMCGDVNATHDATACDVKRCECAEGTFLQNGRCVSREQCNCYVNGDVRRAGSTFDMGRCTTCSCTNGQVSCRPKEVNGSRSCSSDEACDDVIGNDVAWSSWTRCSRSCGVGVQRRFGSFRSRIWETFSEAWCGEPLLQQRDCNIESCLTPTNCSGSCAEEWSSWGSCSSTCITTGKEVSWRHRYRNCHQTNSNCSSGVETSVCDLSLVPGCRDHVTWNAWSHWSECSVTCKTNATWSAVSGFRTRTRTCNGGNACFGESSQFSDCAQNDHSPACHAPTSPPTSDEDCRHVIAGSRYSKCRPLCSITCEGREVCQTTCTPGCYCPDGKVLSHDRRVCVTRQECGCFDDATRRFYSHNETFIRPFPWSCDCKCLNRIITCDRKTKREDLCNWSHWTSCVNSCHPHNRTKVRACSCTSGANVTDACDVTGDASHHVTRDGKSIRVQVRTESCPVLSGCGPGPHGPDNWGQWGPWADCTCTTSYSVRRRHCVASEGCNGVVMQTKPCRWSISKCGLTCPSGLVLSPCGGAREGRCPKTCLGLSPNVRCVDAGTEYKNEINREDRGRRWESCIPQCVCPGGKLLSAVGRNGSPECVEPERCPCFTFPPEGGYKHYSANQTFQHQCRTCSCGRNGAITCSDEKDTKNCTSEGEDGWEAWSNWSECSATCAGGHKSRTRNCTIPNQLCFDSREQVTSCFDDVSCAMSDWGAWSGCSETCGGKRGVRVRSRACRQGSECDERALRQMTRCTERAPCPPAFEQWSQWSDCSQSCDLGFQQRHRQCSNATHRFPSSRCNSSLTWNETSVEQRPCHGKKCRNTTINSWSEWGSWSMCNGRCGVGNQTRRRECGNANRRENCLGDSEQIRFCQLTPCPNMTSSTQCPAGMTSRRNCDTCTRVDTGLAIRLPRACSELASESSISCDPDDCSFVCVCEGGKLVQLGEEESTNQCVSAHQCECVDALQRTWHNGAVWETSSGGTDGETCRSNCTCAIGRIVCDVIECESGDSCDWGQWSSWTSCNATCLGSSPVTRFRFRTRSGHTQSCESGSMETETCDLSPCGECEGPDSENKVWRTGPCLECRCSQNGTVQCSDTCWTQWTPWTACTATCGANSTQSRARSCMSDEHCSSDVTTFEMRNCRNSEKVVPCPDREHATPAPPTAPGDPDCSDVTCNDVTCRDGEVKVVREGSCCASCKPEEVTPPVPTTCQLHTEKRNFSLDGCASRDTEIRYCAGNCRSSVHVLPYEPFVHSKCECCTHHVSELYSHVTVTLHCPDGSELMIEVPNIERCSCTSCSGNAEMSSADP